MSHVHHFPASEEKRNMLSFVKTGRADFSVTKRTAPVPRSGYLPVLQISSKTSFSNEVVNSVYNLTHGLAQAG